MLAHLPLTTPSGTQLRGPTGSLRCSIHRAAAELGATHLKQSSLYSRWLCATRPLRWDVGPCSC